VSEGDDKPVKYPKAFVKTDLVVLNKTDMLRYSDFNIDFFSSKVRELNPPVIIIPVSCKTGDNLKSWTEWIKKLLKSK
ncbi:MAG: hydrogenase nickel incorporation protein HypB, partial [Actinobacteria bacterium]|nr:hydrogenase nickel incorporation protein HypB [Actinomycetota bacterium]